MKKIPVTEQLPPFPRELLEEADHLFNVTLNNDAVLGEKLSLLYAFVDRLNENVVSRLSSCKKGCSHCCHMDVQVTTLEASYVAFQADIPFLEDRPLSTGHKSACIFLSSSGTCLIYPHRPLFCRTYHSMSPPELCAIPGAEIAQYGTVLGGMGNPVFRAAVNWIHYQNRHCSGTVKDIRDFFGDSRRAR